MKKIGILLLLILMLYSCEKDDFCTQTPITPNLILRFYDDIDRTSLKAADALYVWAENKDTIFANVSTDSLLIPLNTIDTKTVYNLSKGTIVNQFTIEYDPESIYVSRSCGFKVNFNNVIFSSNNTWITDFIPQEETTISNQNQAHVKIFH